MAYITALQPTCSDWVTGSFSGEIMYIYFDLQRVEFCSVAYHVYTGGPFPVLKRSKREGDNLPQSSD